MNNAGFVYYNGIFDPAANPPLGDWLRDSDSYVNVIYMYGSSTYFDHHVRSHLSPIPDDITMGTTTTTVVIPDPWYTHVLADYNAVVREYLEDVMTGAADVITASRPGLTWAYYLDGVPHTSLDLYASHVGPLMTESYFGTNFLHLEVIPVVPQHLDGDASFAEGLDKIVNYTAEMSGFAVRIWGEQAYRHAGSPRFPTVPPAPYVDPGLPANIDGFVGSASPPANDAVSVPWSDNSATCLATKAANDDLVALGNTEVDTANNFNVAEDPFVNGIVRAFTEASAAEADFAYESDDGDLNSAVDFEAVVAEHYGF